MCHLTLSKQTDRDGDSGAQLWIDAAAIISLEAVHVRGDWIENDERMQSLKCGV